MYNLLAQPQLIDYEEVEVSIHWMQFFNYQIIAILIIGVFRHCFCHGILRLWLLWKSKPSFVQTLTIDPFDDPATTGNFLGSPTVSALIALTGLTEDARKKKNSCFSCWSPSTLIILWWSTMASSSFLLYSASSSYICTRRGRRGQGLSDFY